MSHADRGMCTPPSRDSSVPSASSRSPRAGPSRGSTARAVSGTGTNVVRNCLGSDRISSVTISWRRPGTCQLNSSALTWFSRASGMSTLTPSSGSPGANS